MTGNHNKGTNKGYKATDDNLDLTKEQLEYLSLIEMQEEEQKRTKKQLMLWTPLIFVVGGLLMFALYWMLHTKDVAIKKKKTSSEVCKCFCKCPPCQEKSK